MCTFCATHVTLLAWILLVLQITFGVSTSVKHLGGYKESEISEALYFNPGITKERDGGRVISLETLSSSTVPGSTVLLFASTPSRCYGHYFSSCYSFHRGSVPETHINVSPVMVSTAPVFTSGSTFRANEGSILWQVLWNECSWLHWMLMEDNSVPGLKWAWR